MVLWSRRLDDAIPVDHAVRHVDELLHSEAFELGTVPRDQLIGKAVFVYWPSGHRLDWVPMFSRWGLVPDVGRMRWIR